MVDLMEELTPEERVAQRKKAYDKFINVAQPARQAADTAENSRIARQGMQEMYKGVTEGGYSGRQAASQAFDQTQMELAKAGAQQRSQQDALNLEGAQMKEDIIGSKQQAALSSFNRQTAETEEAMDRAITERAFDMGMDSKEMAFHQNARLADIGFENLKSDYEKGRVDKQELLTVQSNLKLAAQEAKNKADAIIAQMQRDIKIKVREYSAGEAKKLQDKYIALMKEAVKRQADAANIGAIITGVTTIAGGVVGGVMGGPGGAALGIQGGKAFGKTASALAR